MWYLAQEKLRPLGRSITQHGPDNLYAKLALALVTKMETTVHGLYLIFVKAVRTESTLSTANLKATRHVIPATAQQ